MMFLYRRKWVIIIFVLAAVLRFWQLGNVPPSPDWDEAALGYNAYSILKTGRDEYGVKFPLVLRSFDDYKPPLYAYLAIPAIAVFGLNTWAVRLPSAIMGILAVIGVYLFVQALLRHQEEQLGSRAIENLSLWSALLLAISPWHLQFSRIAFEANVGLTLNIWGAALFLKGLKQRYWLIIASGLFGLGLYAYHSERIFLPTLVVLLIMIYRNELLKVKKVAAMALLVGLITVMPLIPVFLNQNTLMRLRGTSSLSDQTGLLARSVQKLEQDRASGNPWGVVFDNRRIVWAKTIIEGYLSHYSFRWLFLTGDNDRHHAPSMGLLYLWELPLLLWGIYKIAKGGGKLSRTLLGWFLIAPLAASPTSELPHAIRSLVFLPTFQIFTAFGLSEFFRLVMRQKSKFLVLLTVVGGLLALFNIVLYLNLYFVHLNREFSRFWQYGYQEAVEYVKQQRFKYEKIVVSTKLEQPHMFFLYFLRYDPQKYLSEGGTASGGFAEFRNRFDIYEFRPIDWAKELHDGKTLYIGTVPEIFHPIASIKHLDGTVAMMMGE